MGTTPTPTPAVLLLHNSPPGFPATVRESVCALSRLSAFPVLPLNTVWGYPQALDRIRFSAIALHYTVFYADFTPLSPYFLEFLSKSEDSWTTAFFQDEQAYLDERRRFCSEFSIDCVFTCIEQPHASYVYGDTGVAEVKSYLPGYVSDSLRRAGSKASRRRQRAIDVGYRGRRAPPEWTGAAQEKYEIAVEFRRRAAGAGLRLDIETDEEKRIYGRRWLRFLASCKATLGTESGADIAFARDSKRKPVPYRTISPRHFEAAAVRTCQILFEGRYSGILKPMVHYIPLRKDFSNFDEVLQRFRDRELREQLVANAHRDLIDSHELGYRCFVEAFDETVRNAGAVPSGQRLRTARSRIRLDVARLGLQVKRIERKARRELGRPSS